VSARATRWLLSRKYEWGPILRCKCCRAQDYAIWKWSRWGGLLPGPVCMKCKVVGCGRC